MPVKTGWTDGLGVGMMHEVNEEEGWTGMNSRGIGKDLRRSFSTAEHYGFHSLAKRICGLSMGYSWMPPKSDENHRFPMKRQFRVYRGLRKNHQATAPLRLNFGFNSCSKTSEIRFNYLSQNTPLDWFEKGGFNYLNLGIVTASCETRWNLLIKHTLW